VPVSQDSLADAEIRRPHATAISWCNVTN